MKTNPLLRDLNPPSRNPGSVPGMQLYTITGGGWLKPVLQAPSLTLVFCNGSQHLATCSVIIYMLVVMILSNKNVATIHPFSQIKRLINGQFIAIIPLNKMPNIYFLEIGVKSVLPECLMLVCNDLECHRCYDRHSLS